MSYSVIIPAKNESGNIKRCIQSIYKSIVDKSKVEIYVVDNGSTDNTREIAIQEGAKVILKENANISELRNIGARYAANEIIGFIDADCEACFNWLENAKQILLDDKIGIVGDHYELPPYPGWIEKVLFSNIPRTRREVPYLSGGNMVTRRDTFLKIGFDESTITGEDYVLCLKMKASGYKILADPDVSVIHHGNAKTLANYFKREVWCGLGMLDLVRYNKITLPFAWSLINILLIFAILLSFLFTKPYLILFLLTIFIILPGCAVTLKAKRSGKFNNLIESYLVYFVYGLARTVSIFKRMKIEIAKLY
jgi:glycosyltransferase involved in cell wall biosynthesis